MFKKMAKEIWDLSESLRTEILPAIEKEAEKLLYHLDLKLFRVEIIRDGRKSTEELILTAYDTDEVSSLLKNFLDGEIVQLKVYSFNLEEFTVYVDDESLLDILREDDEPRILATILI